MSSKRFARHSPAKKATLAQLIGGVLLIIIFNVLLVMTLVKAAQQPCGTALAYRTATAQIAPAKLFHTQTAPLHSKITLQSSSK